MPDWLEAIVQKLLNKLPGDRFESAKHVAEIFEDCLAHAQQPSTVSLPAIVQKLLAANPTAAALRTQRLRQLLFPIFIVAASVAIVFYLGPNIFHDLSRHKESPIEASSNIAADSSSPFDATLQQLEPRSSPAESSYVAPIETWHDGIDQTLQALNQDLEDLRRTIAEPNQ